MVCERWDRRGRPLLEDLGSRPFDGFELARSVKVGLAGVGADSLSQAIQT
jgi:hypothetical protein